MTIKTVSGSCLLMQGFSVERERDREREREREREGQIQRDRKMER